MDVGGKPQGEAGSEERMRITYEARIALPVYHTHRSKVKGAFTTCESATSQECSVCDLGSVAAIPPATLPNVYCDPYEVATLNGRKQ